MDVRIPRKKRRVLAERSVSPGAAARSSPSKRAPRKKSAKHADGPTPKTRGQPKKGKKKAAPAFPKGDEDALCGVNLSDSGVTARDVSSSLLQLLPGGVTANDAIAKKLLKSFPLVVQQLEANSSALARANMSEGRRRPIAFCDSTVHLPDENFSQVLQHLDGRDLVKVGIAVRKSSPPFVLDFSSIVLGVDRVQIVAVVHSRCQIVVGLSVLLPLLDFIRAVDNLTHREFAPPILKGDSRFHLRTDEQEQEFEHDVAAEDAQATAVCEHQKPGPPKARQAGEAGGEAARKDLAEPRVLGLWILAVLWRPVRFGRGAGVNRIHSSESQRTGY